MQTFKNKNGLFLAYVQLFEVKFGLFLDFAQTFEFKYRLFLAYTHLLYPNTQTFPAYMQTFLPFTQTFEIKKSKSLAISIEKPRFTYFGIIVLLMKQEFSFSFFVEPFFSLF
jgi:hypothetical protein